MFLLIALISTLTLAEPATSGSSSAACSSLKTFSSVVQSSQNAVSSTDTETFQSEMEMVANQLGNISLFDMVPQTESTTFSSERGDVLVYLATLREAVREAGVGREQYARTLMESSNSNSVLNSVQTIVDFWGCENDSGKVQEEAARPYPDLYDGGVPMGNPKDAGPGKAAPFGVQYESASSSHESATSDGGDSGSKPINSMSPEEARKTRNNMLIGLIICAIIGTISVRKSMKNRKAVRQMCFIHIMIKHKKVFHRALMLDIGVAGSKICHPANLEKNDRLEIQLNGRWHKAQVRWTSGGYAGVSFLHSISSNALAEVLLSAENNSALAEQPHAA